MRIAHVIEATAGGSARIAAELCRNQIKAGYDVTLVYSDVRADRFFLDAIGDIANLTKINIPMYRSLGLHDAKTLFHFWKFFRNTPKFDIIHSHSSKAGALTRLLKPFFPASKQVYSPHAFYTMAPKVSPLYGWVETALSYGCDAIITVSAFEKQHGIKILHINSKKLHVVPNGVELNWDYNRETARTLLDAKPDEYLIGFVGRLTLQKNYMRLLEVFNNLQSRFPHLRLVMLGDGELKAEIEKYIELKLLKEKVRIISGMDARTVMAGFDCLLCSSDYEGFPVIFLESLAAGVPIVTTPVGGSEEAVIPQKTGRVATDFSVQALSQAMQELLEQDSIDKQLMKLNCKDHARNFSIEIMTEATVAVYKSLLILS